MKAHWIIAGLAVLCSGCSTFSGTCGHNQSEPIGFVTSGGRYCLAQSLAIPPEGLTLGSAVSKVVRISPAIQSTFTGGAPRRQKPELLPIGAQDINLNKIVQTVRAMQTSGKFSDIKMVLVDPPEGGMLTPDEYRVLEGEFRLSVNRVVGEDVFVLSEMDAKEKIKSTLADEGHRSQLSEEITALIKQGGFWPKQNTTNDKAIAFLESVRKRSTETSLSDAELVRNGLVQAHDRVNVREQIFVTLVKQNRRLISAPLWLVTDYSAGDILLSPGDHVELNSFSQTSIGIPTAATTQGNVLAMGPVIDAEIVPLDSILATGDSFESFAKWNGNDVADVIVVRRVELSGQVHDFLLPIPRPELYQQSDAASEILSQAKLQPGDQVHLEVLDLTPMIRESRRMSQQASRFAIEEAAAAEVDLRRSWLQKKFVKHQEHKQRFCAQINSQTELVTGISPAQLAALTGDFHDNLSAQVGMAP